MEHFLCLIAACLISILQGTVRATCAASVCASGGFEAGNQIEHERVLSMIGLAISGCDRQRKMVRTSGAKNTQRIGRKTPPAGSPRRRTTVFAEQGSRVTARAFIASPLRSALTSVRSSLRATAAPCLATTHERGFKSDGKDAVRSQPWLLPRPRAISELKNGGPTRRHLLRRTCP